MKTPHKHAAMIKAWADGESIQYRNIDNNEDWSDILHYASWNDDSEYRIKPRIRHISVVNGIASMEDGTTVNLKKAMNVLLHCGELMTAQELAKVIGDVGVELRSTT